MCEIWEGDYETAQVWRETARRARKAHRCACCRAQIQPGSEYIRHVSISGGRVSDESLCSACNIDRSVFAEMHDGFTSLPSYFRELLDGCISDGDEESDRVWRPMLERIRARGAA